MKKTAKKILCVVLVMLMTVPLIAFQTTASDYAANYDAVADGELIYNANFKGTSGFWAPKGSWAGMKTTIASDGSSITVKPSDGTLGGSKVNLWGDCLPYPNFRILQSAYTIEFTVEAENADQEVGLFLDWKTGFAVTPGKDSFRYVDGKSQKAVTVMEDEYEGTGALTQTYAIEIKDEGDPKDGDKANFVYNVTEYNLYVKQNDVWVQIFSLKDSEHKDAIKNALNLDYDNYELVLRLFRDGLNENQYNKITVSNLNVYKGLAITDGNVNVPVAPGSGITAELIYDVNFKGTSNFWTPGPAWKGMTASVSGDGNSVTLKPNGAGNGETNLWGDDLPYPEYRMLQSAYTAVFTLTASDADQEIGFFFDWKTGFAITPGQDSFRYVDAKSKKCVTVFEDTYEGTKSLTQTYAIEIKDEGVDVDGNKANFQYNITEYNLYVFKDGVWVQIFSLKNADEAVANSIKNATNWDYDNYEFVLRFLRDGLSADQYGEMTVSDMAIYKGIDIFPKLGMADGASVRMNTPTGIRFTGAVDKTYFDGLKTQYGADNVTLGMLITPTDYLTANNLVFTKAALDACEAISGAKYLEIDAITVLEEDAYYKINCAMTNVLEANYARDFSAILYIKVNGEIVEYSAYDAENNSRSIAEVSEAAYNDVKTTADEVYKYATTTEAGVTVYSPYENRDILKDFFA